MITVASIGIRRYGIYRRLSDNTLLIPKVLYESKGTFDQPIPEELAVGYLNEWKQRMLVEQGIVATYLEVNGQNWTVQWYSPTEKSLLGTIVATAIIAIAVSVALYYLSQSLTNLAQETGEIISLLGSENVAMLLQIIALVIILQLISPLLDIARKSVGKG